jgi:hypothetical protein
MSILPVLPLVQEFNKDKPNLNYPSMQSILTDADSRKIATIAIAIDLMKLPYNVQIKIRPNCGQLYLECTEKKEPILPKVKGATKV